MSTFVYDLRVVIEVDDDIDPLAASNALVTSIEGNDLSHNRTVVGIVDCVEDIRLVPA